MGIIKRIYRSFRRNWRSAALGALFALSIMATQAFAASSITPGIFVKLVGLFVQPVTTSYSYGTPVQQPQAFAIASTSGSLTPGPLLLQVAAVTRTGTSSPSAEVSTTTSASEGLNLSWAPVPGASGYAIYIGTSTPGSERSFFMASSTNGVPNNFYTLTSTSSPTFYTVPGQGAGYYTSMGSGTTSIDTTGLIRAQSSATTTCTAALNGSVFYNPNNAHLWLCTGAGPSWTLII